MRTTSWTVLLIFVLTLSGVSGGKKGGWFSKDDPLTPTGVTPTKSGTKGGSTQRPQYTTPLCFDKRQSSTYSIWPYKKKSGNETPQSCADLCTKIHDDEDEIRTCRAFDFNVRTGQCRFFEKTATQDENVRSVDSSKTDIYELDERCWTVENGPPTLPPHVDACSSGSKPLMEKVTGWYLRSTGLAFKGVQESKCYERCLKDKLPSREENYKCLSVSYNAENKACVYLAEIASPLNRRGSALRQDARYNYYAKMCVSNETLRKCKGYVTRFTGHELIGMNDAKISVTSYPECVSACLKAEQKMGFTCLSGMFYNNRTRDNCVLNYADHYEEPTLFIYDPHTVVDYFSVKSCKSTGP